jgi:hypothetical protein
VSDPYRDELLALRHENARLRRLLAEGRSRRGRVIAAVGAELAVGGLSFAALQLLFPLLNAESDRRFWIGAAGIVAIVLADVIALVWIARRFLVSTAHEPTDD